MTKDKLSLEEVENLSYYDFMSHLGVPFFHIGGLKSTEMLAEACKVGQDKKVLMVGCGTGFSSCYMARKLGCNVVGVDIAQVSVQKAQERAKEQNLEDKVEFRVGDAYSLPFEPDTFDAVMTEFVSMFLEKDRAFKEFERVLKPGGYVGINEMYKDLNLPEGVEEELNKAEELFGEVTKLPFKLYSPQVWQRWLEKAGFKDVEVSTHRAKPNVKEALSLLKDIGFGVYINMLFPFTKYIIKSKKIRGRIKKVNQGKRILLNKKPSSEHTGYILGVGKKAPPSPEALP